MSEQIENTKFNQREYNKKYYKNNRKQLLESAKVWRNNHRIHIKQYKIIHRKEIVEYRKQYDRSLKIKALSKIDSNLKCVRCGCDNLDFIEKNHKNGGGTQEAKNNGYTWSNRNIISNKRQTDDLELLCRPCNHIHYLEKKFGLENTGLKVVWEKPNND